MERLLSCGFQVRIFLTIDFFSFGFKKTDENVVFRVGLCGNYLMWTQQIICYRFVGMMLLGSYHLQGKVEAFST